MKLKVISKKLNISKKFLVVIGFLLLAILSTLVPKFFANADNGNSQEVMQEISSSVFDILDGVDLSQMEELVSDIENTPILQSSVREKIESILRGEYFTNYTSLAPALLSLIFGDIRSVLPFVFSLIAIGLLCNLVTNLRSSNSNFSPIVDFIFLSVTVLIVLVVFKNILSTTNKTISLILTQMQIIFPILITLLGTIGSVSSISIYNPLVAVLTTGVTFVFDKLLYPIFILVLILTILGHLTDTIKFDKINGFLMSTFKWTISIVFTLFTGFLSIQGISAGKFDSVSIKATKFAMKSYIPIIGSYVSDGMDFFVLGATLVKNSIGLVGVLILAGTILSPIIMIIIYKLALQLSSGVMQMTGNSKISDFLGSVSKILVLPIVLIVGIAFMYIITICLIMCTANVL